MRLKIKRSFDWGDPIINVGRQIKQVACMVYYTTQINYRISKVLTIHCTFGNDG